MGIDLNFILTYLKQFYLGPRPRNYDGFALCVSLLSAKVRTRVRVELPRILTMCRVWRSVF